MEGAVYNPVLETVPWLLPPDTRQVTPVELVPVTAACNCSDCPAATEETFGNTFSTTPLNIQMLAVLLMAGLAALTAVTLRLYCVGGVDGAVYRPAVEIVPSVEFPPRIPFTYHLTEVLLDPATVAAN